MDIVFIDELCIEAIVGIFEWERRAPQRILVSIEMASDIIPAAKSENIQDALDYKAVCDRVRTFIVDSKFQLVETMAQRTAELIMREFAVVGVRMKISKPDAISDAKAVGVKIVRGEIPLV